MKNFLAGLLLGVAATYWCMTEGVHLHATIAGVWERASAPPVVPRAVPRSY